MEYFEFGSLPPPQPPVYFCHELTGLRLLTQHFPFLCHRRPAEEFSRLDYKIQKRVLLQRTDLIHLSEAKRWISESPSESGKHPLLNEGVKISESPAPENGGGALPEDVANDERKKPETVAREEYWSCGLCKVIVNSEITWNKHLEGRKHKRKEAAVVKKQVDPEKIIGGSEYQKKFEFWCEACEVGTHSLDVMGNHKNGKRHVSRIKELIAQPWV